MKKSNENNQSENLHEALEQLSKHLVEKERLKPIPFRNFLELIVENPYSTFRDIFQVFHDMVHFYVKEHKERSKNLFAESYFKNYNCYPLLQDGCDNPFFADRLFANRFMNLVNGFKDGTRTNQIVLFDGPPGSGKSTFLNNLLHKLEDYTKTNNGSMYSTYWKLDVEKLGGLSQSAQEIISTIKKEKTKVYNEKYLEFLCPSHDHPILLIPKEYRKTFLSNLIDDKDVLKRLFKEKQFEWIFNDVPCSICKSLYNALLDKLENAQAVYNMVNAKKVRFNRQFGDGISLYNPGDQIYKKPITNKLLEEKINNLVKGEHIHFIYSILAKTNNGVFALMDIKEENIKRLIQLHGVISDGIHKVELIEERIKSLFFGLVNPGDKVHYSDIPSFNDRVVEVKIPYILDYNIEVSIYKNQLGEGIEEAFLPGVLQNFAKIMVSSRLSEESKTIKNWIRKASDYKNYVDNDFQFSYIEHQTLEFNENTHISSLTSVVSFYIYTVLALDYYTFSLDGGVSYMQKAQTVVNNAQSAPERGWKAFESNKNRYWIAEEFLDAKYSAFTEAMYYYHRMGLDRMFEDPEKGRASVTESLELLRKVKRQNPTAFILQLFFDAKSSELASVYSDAFPDEKARVINLLTELDPSNISKYNKIKEQQQNSNERN